MGILNLQRQDYKKAESTLHVALKMAQERKVPQAETYIFDILPNVAYKKGEHWKAEKLFGQTKDAKDEQGFRVCINTQQKRLEVIHYADNAVKLTEAETNNLVLWAISKEGYGRHLLEQTRFQKARECFEQALVSEKVNGPSHDVTLTYSTT
ncbi:hypothetical protein HPB47_010589 [Ixodes persulcatus]|uniref:Uncharacterized protein n=1 Tax=Ixodes persulcatus TaxID=34615 RepID=A0AC60NYN1_IXOPE|nr:hypothetical protein HPB47_010589 [Ixodes persulcatus]